jgi:hypothetical protein
MGACLATAALLAESVIISIAKFGLREARKARETAIYGYPASGKAAFY